MAEESPREIYNHPGQKTKSSVWKHFGFYKIRQEGPAVKSNLDMTLAICRLCKKTYKNNGNTTNFRVHINSEHKLVSEDLSENTKDLKDVKGPTPGFQTQPTINFSLNKSTLGIQRKETIDNALHRLIVGKVLPTSLVTNQYFKDFVKALEPRYTLPTRQKLMENLHSKKEAISEKLREDIRGCEGVGITHDGWTSTNTESYNTTTIHYLDKNWGMKTAVLGTKKMEGSHTSENIAKSLMETKKEWLLPNVIATSDNAANEVKAFQLLQWERFGCYGHRINLVVRKALELPEISRILGKGRRLVTLFHTSSSVNDVLKEKQKLLLEDNLVGHKLIGDVATRWNSTLAMLKRLLEQLPALMAVATDDKVNKSARTTIKNCLPTFDETSIAEKIVDLLQPFQNATEVVCAEKVPTLNKVLPLVVKLQRALKDSEDDLKIISAIKLRMRDQLDLRTTTEDLALLACVLSPYTKGFEFLPEQRASAEALLRKAVSTVQIAIKKEPEWNEGPPATALPELPSLPSLPTMPDNGDLPQTKSEGNVERLVVKVEDDIAIPKKKKCVEAPEAIRSMDTEEWLEDVICVGYQENDQFEEDLLQREISRYLGSRVSKADGLLTVLEWWKQNAVFYPRLSVIARRILCIQASSVSSERVFSLAGELVSKKRSRLTPENVDLFIFLNKNMSFWR